MTRRRGRATRRRFLAGAGSVGIAGLAGCSGLLQSRSPYAPPVVENRPDAVYYPSHVEGMKMAGMQKAGPYACALTYTYPHRFWLVTGTHTERVSIQPEDSVHLMPVVWDRETGTVLPDAQPTATVRVASKEVTTVNPWTMLSQPMGVHFGDNVQLPSEGEYTIDVRVAPPSVDRSDRMPRAPDGPATCSFEFTYSRADRDDISLRKFPDKKGSRGAVPAMQMGSMPTSQVPTPDALPGRPIGSATTGDATVYATAVADATPFGGAADQTYLAVSPRTPYDRHMLPGMTLSATLARGGETVFDDHLAATLDPDLSLHYGAPVDGVESGDDLTITVDATPQVARHEGYETAFLDMPPVDLTVP